MNFSKKWAGSIDFKKSLELQQSLLKKTTENPKRENSF